MQTWFEKLKADFVLNFVQANRWKYLLDGLGKTLLITTKKPPEAPIHT